MNTNKITHSAPIAQIIKDIIILSGKYNRKRTGTMKERQLTIPHLNKKSLTKGSMRIDIERDTNTTLKDCSKITMKRYTYIA